MRGIFLLGATQENVKPNDHQTPTRGIEFQNRLSR